MKASRDLLVRKPLVETQLDDLAVGSPHQIDHFPEQNKQLSFLGKGLRVLGRGSLAFKLILALADPFPMEIPGHVGDDEMCPGAGLGTLKAGMIDGLEDLDPTGLKDILGQVVADADRDTVERPGGFDVVMEKIVQRDQENPASNGAK